MTIDLGKVGRVFAALVVTILYGVYGVGLGYLLFMQLATTRNLVWFDLFRPLFYSPAILVLVYLYYFKKDKGLFLESLAFLFTLSLAVLWTLEIIVYILPPRVNIPKKISHLFSFPHTLFFTRISI